MNQPQCTRHWGLDLNSNINGPSAILVAIRKRQFCSNESRSPSRETTYSTNSVPLSTPVSTESSLIDNSSTSRITGVRNTVGVTIFGPVGNRFTIRTRLASQSEVFRTHRARRFHHNRSRRRSRTHLESLSHCNLHRRPSNIFIIRLSVAIAIKHVAE